MRESHNDSFAPLFLFYAHKQVWTSLLRRSCAKATESQEGYVWAKRLSRRPQG